MFRIYKEIQMGPGAKSYMRRLLVIHGFFIFIIYEKNFIFFFISVQVKQDIEQV